MKGMAVGGTVCLLLGAAIAGCGDTSTASTCQYAFDAAIRGAQGTTHITGVLRPTAGGGGSVSGDIAAYILSGSGQDTTVHTLSILGEEHGGTIDITFKTPDGAAIDVTGPEQKSVGTCSGAMSGAVKAPDGVAEGDWAASAVPAASSSS